MTEAGPWMPVRDHRILLAVRTVPAVLLIGSLVFDVFVPNDITPTPVVAATPAVALGLFSLPGIVVTVAATIMVAAALLALHSTEGHSFTEFLIDFVSVLLVSVTVLVLGAYKQRASHRFATLSVVAETVQRAVLPPAPPQVGPMRLAVSYRPAGHEALVGGDAYAVEHTAHGVRLLIADVRGKGLGAIHTVAALTGAFRTAAHSDRTLDEIAAQLEYAFATNDAVEDGGESFATAVLVEIPDEPDRPALLINRGHPPPILLVDGAARLVEPDRADLPLGLGALSGTRAVRGQRVDVPPGSTLVLYTDGVSEARNARGVFLDPVTVLDPGHRDPDTVVTALSGAVNRHTDNHPNDDATILAVHRPARSVTKPAGRESP